MDAAETGDIYELVVERHQRRSIIAVSNREPPEWLATMADPLLAQGAVDRLVNGAHELVLDGESYRRPQKPTTGGTGWPPTPDHYGALGFHLWASEPAP